MKSNFAHERLESNILNILNNTLKNEIYDQTVRQASFTAVKLTNDHSYATIYVDTYDRSNIDKIVGALTSAKGVFRTSLAKNLKTYKVPQLRIVKDESIDNSLKIEKILVELKNK